MASNESWGSEVCALTGVNSETVPRIGDSVGETADENGAKTLFLHFFSLALSAGEKWARRSFSIFLSTESKLR